MSADELMTVQCVVKRQFNPASLTGTYQALNGPGGFSDNAKIMQMYNPSTTVSIDLSLDGVNDHIFLPPLATLIVDCQTNHADNSAYGSGTLIVKAGQLIYGKTAAQPTYLQIMGYR